MVGLWVALGVLLAAALTWYFARLRFISSRIGSFQCSVLRAERWREGYACYAVGRLDWYPLYSIASKPALSWTRGDCDVISVQYDDAGQSARVVMSEAGTETTLSLPSQAYSGLRSWLESAPPTPATYK